MARMSRAQLDREVQARAGCVILRYARSTKTLVGLYRSLESGIEADPEVPWTTLCEDHGSLVCHENKANALASLSHPEEWCAYCVLTS